jgi:hypothetical protein
VINYRQTVRANEGDLMVGILSKKYLTLLFPRVEAYALLHIAEELFLTQTTREPQKVIFQAKTHIHNLGLVIIEKCTPRFPIK